MMMENGFFQYALYLLLPFSLTLILTPLVRGFALKSGFICYPRADRWHKHPTALLGGIGIYLSFILSCLVFGLLARSARGLFLGGVFLFSVGLADDRFHFAPYLKLFAQIIAGCIAIFCGISIGFPNNIILSMPLTLFWIIALTNAFNLLDNIDGLAAGIAAIAFLILFFSSLLYENLALGVFALVLCGATLGFLPYNFNPAKIFMGDSGSMFLGYSLAVISISGTPRHIPNLLITMVVPVLILCVPIFDTVFVMIARKLRGAKIFQGGKDHTSHRLITLGLSPRKTAILLYAISAVFGAIAILYSRLDPFLISVIAFLSLVILFYFGVFIFEVSEYKKEGDLLKKQNQISNDRVVLSNVFAYKRRIVEVFLDFIFICIAYYCAYFLRFEGQFLENNLSMLRESLLWIILLKLACFFACGLYRGVWRYIGISDFFTVFKSVTMASIVSVLFVTFKFRFREYSRAVFFIDWLLLLFLILGSRFLFRIIGEFFSRLSDGNKRVLIFGAGDIGEMVIREIKRNKSLNYMPVGFIDDNPQKLGQKIHGVPVLANRGRIKEIVRSHGINEVLIAVHSLELKNLDEILKICNDCGVPFKRVKGILDEERADEFHKN